MLKALGTLLVAVVVAVVVAVGGWQLGWWMKASAVNHNARIYEHSYGHVEGNLGQIDDDLNGYNAPGVTTAQRQYLAGQICDLAGQSGAANLPPYVLTWTAAHGCPQQ